MPLLDIEGQQREAELDFDRKWEDGEIKGWEEIVPKAPANGKESNGIWCSACKYYNFFVIVMASYDTLIKAKRTTRSKLFTTPT